MPTLRQLRAATVVGKTAAGSLNPLFSQSFPIRFCEFSSMAKILHGSMPSTNEKEARKEKVMEAFGSNPIQKISDRELVEAAKCGDTQAFDQLVSRYQRKALPGAPRIAKHREE